MFTIVNIFCFVGLSLVVEVVCGEWRISALSYGIFYILFLQSSQYHGIHSHTTIFHVLIPHVYFFLDADWHYRFLCRLYIHQKDIRSHQNRLKTVSP